jgi:hypothetical protein
MAVEFLYVPARVHSGFLVLTIRRAPLDRLENEHLGNMDQYRVTREVPLPYLFDDPHRHDADDDDDEETKHIK